MRESVDFVTALHVATKRDYLQRMNDSKVESMIIAKQYGREYWDGHRRYGYGGYKFIPGRWKPVAQALIENYKLGPGSKILDIGCGKGFLLYEMQLLQPNLEITGIDVSQYALDNLHPDLNGNFFIHKAQESLPFRDNEFDLVVSMGTLHNLHLDELEIAFSELERVGKSSYVMVESFRNEREMFNVECWALTAETLISVQAWKWLFTKFGFTGDFEFVYFE